MTSLSAYLRMERIDVSESVEFYVPGATSWHDPHLRLLHSRRTSVQIDPLFPAPSEPDELEEH